MGQFIHLQPGRATWDCDMFVPPSPSPGPWLHQDEDGLHFLPILEEDVPVAWVLYVPPLLRSKPSITLRLNFLSKQVGTEFFDLYVFGANEDTSVFTGIYMPPAIFPVTFAAPLAGIGYYATYLDFDIQDSMAPPITPMTTHMAVYLTRNYNEAPELDDVIFFNGRTLPVFV